MQPLADLRSGGLQLPQHRIAALGPTMPITEYPLNLF